MSNDTLGPEPVQSLPSDVSRRLEYWHGLWEASAKYHYFFGVISVAASVISTSVEGWHAKVFSIIAAIATALIGFMHPERRYIKYVRAWRVLDVAGMRYRHGLIEKKDLIDAVEQGEALIAEFEEKFTGAPADANGATGGMPTDATPGAVTTGAPSTPASPASGATSTSTSTPAAPDDPAAAKG